jgi:hypothetical protein
MKMVPDPLLPTRGGSSPKWGAAEEIIAHAPARHTPSSPRVRFTRQFRGHRVHEVSIASRASMRRDNSPDSHRAMYEGARFSTSDEDMTKHFRSFDCQYRIEYACGKDKAFSHTAYVFRWRPGGYPV